MRRATVRFGLILLAVALVSACATGGTAVPVITNDVNILHGSWEGGLTSRGTDGRVYFETSITLNVRDGTGRFELGTGSLWDTSVRVKDRKVLLDIDQGSREFELRRGSDGKLRLVSTYAAKWEGWDRINTVSLTKK